MRKLRIREIKFSSQVKELEFEFWSLAPEPKVWLKLTVGGEQNFTHEALKVGASQILKILATLSECHLIWTGGPSALSSQDSLI